MLKKIILCSSVFLIVALAQGYADEHFPFLGEVSKASVNVRAGANTNFEAVDKLAKGADVVVVGRHYEWYKVQLPSTAGAYIRADYVKDNGNGTGEISGDKVNVRAKPKSEASSLGQMKKGDLVKLGPSKDGWWQIEPPASTEGWIHADFLQMKSAQVPAELVRGPVVALPVPPPAAPVAPAGIDISGKVQSTQASGQTTYQIIVDGKPAYDLQDMPHLDRFDRSTVKVEGAVTPSETPNTCPVLHVHKITLIL